MKIIKVNMCVGCPSCEYMPGSEEWYCREIQKFVDKHSIHHDCPLEDAKEAPDAG